MTDSVIQHGKLRIMLEPSDMSCAESVVIKFSTGEVIQVWGDGNDTGRPVVYQWDSVVEFEDGTEAKLQLDVPARPDIVRRIHLDHLEYCIELRFGSYYVHVLDDNSEELEGREPESPELPTLQSALKWVTGEFAAQLLRGAE